MWSPRNRVGYSRRITTIVSSPPLDERTASDDESFTTFDEHVLSMKVCILFRKIVYIFFLFP